MCARLTGHLAAVISVAVTCLAPVALAAEFAWAEPNDGDFGDPANWNDGMDGVPGAGDVAIFDVLGLFAVNIMTSRTNDRLVARSGNVTLEFLGDQLVYELLGGAGTAPGVLIGDEPRDVAGITVSGGTLRADRMSIARMPASSGSLSTIGPVGVSMLDVGVLVVGEGGTGYLSAGTFTADRIEVGLGASGFGDVTLGGTTGEVTEEIVIGGAGIGLMTVGSSTMLSTAAAVVGRDAGGGGRMTVLGTVQIDGHLEIGRDGRGVLDVEHAALVDVGGDLTARLMVPADPPIVVRISSSVEEGPAIAVTGNAAIDVLAIENDPSYVPALDDEFLLVTADSGLMDTPVVDSELPLGLAWEVVRTDSELHVRVVTDPCPPGPGEDCNANRVRDECDIAFGTSLDCNANGIPDECDVASGAEDDCNANLVPDPCDIADGASEDCNGDGIPDDCTPADLRTLLDALGGTGDAFGEAVDVHGDLAVVGSPDASPPYATVFVQRGTRWVRDARLLASDGTVGDGFGGAVGAGDGIVVVGAGAGEAGGAAYVFARAAPGTWLEVIRLDPPFETVEGFGTAVDATDGFVIVGARQNVGAAVRGVGYIFASSKGWALDGSTLAGLTSTAVRPGAGVAINGDAAAIVWPGDAVAAPGAFSFIERVPSGVWFTRRVAFPPGIVAGSDVGVSANALAGRFESEDVRGVVVYRRNLFSFEIDTLIAQLDGDSFGAAIDASEGRLAIGASDDGAAGRVYTYRQAGGTTWQLDEMLEPDASSDASFGAAVGLDVGRLIAGAPDDDAQGTGAGAAWIADLPGPDCNGNGVIDRCDILDGTSVDEDGDGVPDECADTCPWDLDGSGRAGFTDLAELLGSWGPCPNCRADVNGDGTVGFDELSTLLGSWGPCH